MHLRRLSGKFSSRHSSEEEEEQQQHLINVGGGMAGGHRYSGCRKSAPAIAIAAATPFACLFLAAIPCFSPDLFFSPLGRLMPSLFSEWEAPRTMHPHLLDAAERARLKESEPAKLWSLPPKKSWSLCVDEPSIPVSKENTTGYLQVFLEGGLNQQRMAICDAVALARILNVTLLLPQFDLNPFWQDSSSFADIFDVGHFIRTLQNDVVIVEELPKEMWWSTRDYYATGIRATRVKHTPSRAPPSWFIENVLPVIHTHGIAAVVPFSHRLAYDGIPLHIQKLRCKVNFEALRFRSEIQQVGDAIINRLRGFQSASGSRVLSDHQEKKGSDDDGDVDSGMPKFIALHLRFDKDMAAHSACDFGGGKMERLALAKYRRDLWQGRVSNSHLSDAHLRERGKCPLTPEEVGLMLAALGFGRTTRLYLASYRVYGGAARMAPLERLFPFMESKYSLATEEEMIKFRGKASILAALDYYVCLHSDVFISASPGNMHNALVGHRQYEGVKKTIRPHLILLSQLFMNSSIGWQEFRNKTMDGHRTRMGSIKERNPGQSLYTYPAPDCLCQQQQPKATSAKG